MATDPFYTIELDYESPSYYENGSIDLTEAEARKIYNDLHKKFDWTRYIRNVRFSWETK